MKRLLFLILLASAPLCAQMTQMNFSSVKMGSTIQEVTKQVGPPYAVHDLGKGLLEYEYIERFSMNNELIYNTHYVLTVVNGQVVDKRECDEYRPMYDYLYQPDPNYPSYP